MEIPAPSTSDTNEQAIAQPRRFVPTSTPINILLTPAAQSFTNVQPALVLAYFTLRFTSLVADPVATLFFDLFPLTALQCAFAVVCLPPNGASPQTKAGKQSSSKRHGTTKSGPDASTGAKIKTSILAILLTFFTGTPLLYIVLVLFGAPITTHHAETYLCACHMTVLGIFPLFYVYGVSRQMWWEIGGAMLPFDAVWGSTVGTMVGAWLGAIPIPLDWDRDWQTWPITIVTGAYLGCILGRLLGEYLFRGKRIKFD